MAESRNEKSDTQLSKCWIGDPKPESIEDKVSKSGRPSLVTKRAFPKAIVPVSSSTEAKNKVKIFEMLLKVFDLQSCYPQKLTLKEALEVRESVIDDSNICSNRKCFYIMVIKRILSFDCKCFLKLDSSAIEDIAHELRINKLALVKKGKVMPRINPLDGLITVLLCADNFLRQDLMYRLATCQIAVPLVLPDPMTGDLTLTLWSLRKIVKQWEDSKSHGHEVSIISYPTPVVSFVRFGKHKRSKSKLINIVMKNNSTNDTFFHYDCGGGSTPKFLTKGLIDMAWYIPSDGDHSLSEPVTFLNLHGDALKLEKQINFLRDVCLMHFVLLNAEGLEEPAHQEVLQTFSQSPGGVVLLQYEKSNKTDETDESDESSEIEVASNVQVVIDIDSNNEDEIKTEVWGKIKDCIERNWNRKAVPKTKYADVAQCCGIKVDEDDTECAEGISLAAEFENILKAVSTPKKLLVLQGAEYWHKIAQKEKETHRQRKGKLVDEHKKDIHDEISSIRRSQKSKVSGNSLIDAFLRTLSTKRNVRNYYLQRLKLLLHDFSCEKLLPLHIKYQRKKKTLEANVKEIEKHKKDLEKKVRQEEVEQYLKVRQEVVEKCKRELEQLGVEIMNASFGLEHLLREIGQMYEASTFFRSQKYNYLPGMVADLVIDGHPLELMDGDVAHVPKHWVLAVLKEVKKKLNDPFVVPLTILGLQSSGKSTLLNTLFGVNFSVSAGRCTRGAFMQLVPFHSSVRKNCYILLVDTEGLRAPQLDARETHHHDNQLATFVIGLAHYTVINIYGEVLADMNDILQTAVHAFLRMKEVKHLTTGVHFVHQNVTSKMAAGQNLDGRDKMKANLDKMTVVAAKEEEIEKEYTCFDDVLHFDSEKDVTYFPALWYGNPPMAPVNPKYSAEARKLQQCLIQHTKSCTQLVLSHFTKYLKSLWDAILQENFIFSFKNTLEMAVFSILDYERSKWFWKFREEVMKREDKFETEIHAITRVDGSAEKKYEAARVEVMDTVSVTYIEIRKEVERFFKEHAEREILVNWQAETERLLESLHDELSLHAKQYCEQMWNNIKAKQKVNKIKHSHQKVISVKVKELISHLDRQKRLLSEHELKIKFEEQWEEWIKPLNAQTSTMPKPHNIELEMQEALKDHFKMQLPTLIKKITPSEEGKSLQSWGRSLHLQLDEKHIKRLSLLSKASKVASGLTFGLVGKDEKWRPLAEEETKHHLGEVEKYLREKENKDFNPSFTTKIIILLQEKVEIFKSDMFEFTLEYRMDLTLTACGYALEKFQQMAQRYRDENDPVKCLEREKPQYFNDFCDQYSKTAKEVIAARQCCEFIESAIKKRVMKSLCLTVVQKMKGDEVNSFLLTKRTLIKQVLICISSDLKKGKFDTCSKYLRHPMETLQEYVKIFTESYCDEGYPRSRLTKYAEELLMSNMEFVRKSLNEMNDRHQPLKAFIEKLTMKLSRHLIIDGRIRCELGGKGNIKNFTDELYERFRIMEENLKQKFVLRAKDMEKWDEKPYDMIFERVSGCKEMCPFCHEPCNNTYANHSGDHTIDLHRPNCLGGWRHRGTNKMCLKNCSECVANDFYFYPSANSDEKYPYRQCERVYPRWHIKEGLSTEASLYWKYVVFHFKSQLAWLYNMKEDDVPKHWEGLELTQAIEAL